MSDLKQQSEERGERRDLANLSGRVRVEREKDEREGAKPDTEARGPAKPLAGPGRQEKRETQDHQTGKVDPSSAWPHRERLPRARAKLFPGPQRTRFTFNEHPFLGDPARCTG